VIIDNGKDGSACSALPAKFGLGGDVAGGPEAKTDDTATTPSTAPGEATSLADKTEQNHNLIELPSICLGTMGLGRKSTQDVVQSALRMGMTGVDTAPTYNNEDLVGAALSPSSFVIAKIPKRATTGQQVREELTSTLQKLQRTSVDLLLLHWPCDIMTAGTTAEVWKEMEEFVLKDKTVSALGVCNFSVDALRLLLPHCQKVKPRVVQVERHPLLTQWDLLDFCAQYDIVLQAHTPLGQGKLLQNSVVIDIAQSAKCSPAQVLLQWNLQQGVAVVPKTGSESHLQEILWPSLSPLSNQHMQTLNELVQPLEKGSSGTSQIKRFVDAPFMKGNDPWCWSK